MQVENRKMKIWENDLNILGADFVMLGGMLAGHDESGSGEITERNGKKYKLFYGMSSKTAMDKHVWEISFSLLINLNSLEYFSPVVLPNIEHRKAKLSKYLIEVLL